jgi:putative ABC transport system permease protein
VSLITVLLSGAGLYALMSFTVAERTREIGIRSALGARPARLVATIARRAFLQLLTGVTIGAALAGLLLRSVQPGSDVLQVTNWPVTVPIISLGVVIAGMLACVPPTRRGLRIQPAEALKS